MSDPQIWYRFESLLLGVWREACRHIEIAESTATIAPMLAEHMPVAQVLVRRIDTKRRCLETVALGLPAATDALPEGRTECTSAEMQEVLSWCRLGEVAAVGAERKPPLSKMAHGIDGDLLIGPLGDKQQPYGLLVLVAQSGQQFDAQHVSIAREFLEPFSTALENDGRLREMTAMRAAAEADKQSLLTRLGRKELDPVVVGADSGLRGVMERVELVARSDVPVLILGETGTGKELVARVIHTRSSRAGGPFLRVNCGAIPLELIDSQLFGHERGAFTGAVETRQGWFERADGGTLLLDEIGELPLAAQVRLLRILQDGWLERVGGHQPISVDVRIVAATHRDLATMVADGRFREDLWYRINVFPIRLPTLRERQSDIPAIARHFAQRAAARFMLPLVLPTPEDIQLLVSYPWPGNIRELGAVIDRAAILGNGERLDVATALGVGASPVVAPIAQKPQRVPQQESAAEFLSLDAAIKQHIEAALRRAGGQIEGARGAAKLLKVNPHTLRSRMRKLGIDWQRFREADLQ